MIRHYPTDKWDKAEAKKLGAEQWQLELLKLNPDYVSWGPHEDYMYNPKKDGGWDKSQFFGSWEEFGPWGLDELNECVNFYFSIDRANKQCPTCGGNGYHPKAQQVVNGFYAHMNDEGEHWHDNITQDEVEALVKAKRLWDFTRGKPEGYVPTAAEVNANQRGFGHDAINRGILTETRLKRLGLPIQCPECDGDGYVYTAPEPHVVLTLWMLHPRKGCSRGVEVENITQKDLSGIYDFLRTAAQRNAARFSLIPKLTVTRVKRKAK